MKRKHMLSAFLILFLGIAVLSSKNVASAAEKGQVTFSLAVEEKKIEEYQKTYQDGAGVYVFVKNLDTEQTYRFPMNQANNYIGTFQVDYGNYQVIPNPEARETELVVKTDSVFTVSDTIPIVEVKCYLEAKNTGTKTPSPQADKETAISKETVSQEESSSGSGMKTFQRIFTIIAFLAIGGIWVYNRFIKYRVGGKNHFEDE